MRPLQRGPNLAPSDQLLQDGQAWQVQRSLLSLRTGPGEGRKKSRAWSKSTILLELC